jgi:hypothetical protein
MSNVLGFSIHDVIPSFGSKERNHNIFICIKRREPNSEEMFLNKQETHNTKERVVESASRDIKEEV